MIHDLLACHARYETLNPRFAAAFQFLLQPGLAEVPDGKHLLDGKAVVCVRGTPGRPRPGRFAAGSPPQVHRHPIHHLGRGSDRLEAMSLSHSVSEAYNPERDIGFFKDQPESWLYLPEGRFSIFFPEDAHAPLAGSGPVHKVVMKVACGGQG